MVLVFIPSISWITILIDSLFSWEREIVVVEEEIKEKLGLDRKSSSEKSEEEENILHQPGPEIDEVRHLIVSHFLDD